MISIFIDGACKNNPGKGGVGVVFKKKEYVYKIARHSMITTTNNRMELCSLILALNLCASELTEKEKKLSIKIFTDSKYLICGWENAIEWRMKNWKTKAKTSVLNQDLWEIILEKKTQNMILSWVPREENQEADFLASLSVLDISFFVKTQEDLEFSKTNPHD